MRPDAFPYFSEGSNLTPAHHFPDFRFKTYAPVAFRYFRELFGIRPDDYLVSSRRIAGGLKLIRGSFKTYLYEKKVVRRKGGKTRNRKQTATRKM